MYLMHCMQFLLFCLFKHNGPMSAHGLWPDASVSWVVTVIIPAHSQLAQHAHV